MAGGLADENPASLMHRAFCEGPPADLAEEIKRLNVAVDAFAVEMKAKLVKKAEDGWRGWDSSTFRLRLVHSLIDHANRVEFDPTQAIDIGAIAMMLWWQWHESQS